MDYLGVLVIGWLTLILAGAYYELYRKYLALRNDDSDWIAGANAGSEAMLAVMGANPPEDSTPKKEEKT